MRFTARTPDIKKAGASAVNSYSKAVRRAAIIATDRASKEAQRAVQSRIRSVGLGRLAGAVGQTSTLKERTQSRPGRPYGVLFARGGDESLAGGALESYSRGSVIRAQNGQWMAFATKAVPRFMMVGGQRRRTTPDLFRNSSLATSIGKLIFKPIGQNKAVLVIRKVSLSPKTGRAKALGPRGTRTRVPVKEVVAFVLIRVTRRAQRFDKDAIILNYARRVPGYMIEILDVPGGYRSTR